MIDPEGLYLLHPPVDTGENNMIFPRTKYIGGTDLQVLACSPNISNLVCKIVGTDSYAILKPDYTSILGVGGFPGYPLLNISEINGTNGIIISPSTPLPAGLRAFYIEGVDIIYRYYLYKETPGGKVYVCDDRLNTGLAGTEAVYIPAEADDITPILPPTRKTWTWEIFLGSVDCSIRYAAGSSAVPVSLDDDYIDHDCAIKATFWAFSEPAELVIESDSPPWVAPGITKMHLLFSSPAGRYITFDPAPNNSMERVLASKYQQAHYEFSLNLRVEQSHYVLAFYRASRLTPASEKFSLDRIIFDM